MVMKIGFIGMAIMGQPIHANGLALQVEQAVANYYERAMKSGLEEMDLSAIKKVIA